MKYNSVIMLKEILKHTCKYLNEDDNEWIIIINEYKYVFFFKIKWRCQRMDI